MWPISLVPGHQTLYQLYPCSCPNLLVPQLSDLLTVYTLGRNMSSFLPDISQFFHLNPILEFQEFLAIFPLPSWHDFSCKLVHPVCHLPWKLFSTIPAYCCSVLYRAWGFSENQTISQWYALGSKPNPLLLWSAHLGDSIISPLIEVYGERKGPS